MDQQIQQKTKMIIIDNKKAIKLRSVLIIFLLIITAPAMVWFKGNMLILFALALLFIRLLFRLIRLKYFRYENSVEVISIRHHHIFKKNARPNAEFPINIVQNIILKKETFRKKVVFELKKESSGKIVKIQYSLQGLSTKQLQSLMKQ